jgi:hypothetical protein
MHQTAQFEDALAHREITIRQSLFLVVYMFTGLMFILAIVSALAASPRSPDAPPLGNSLQLSTVVSDTQEEIVK